MPLLPNGYNPQNLQDVINQSTGSQTANLTDSYQQQRKQAVADQASSGRLMSGVSSYPLTDLDTQYQQGLSGIQTNAANETAGIPAEDWLNSQNFSRSSQLASLIGSLNKPSTLDEVFQGIGALGPTAAMGAALL
jgi:hypothetical protein